MEKDKYEKLLEGNWSGYPDIEAALSDYIRIYLDSYPARDHRADRIYSWIRSSHLWQPEWNKDLEAKRTWIFSIAESVLKEYQCKPKVSEKSARVKPTLPLTDAGNAQRLAVLAQHDFKHVLKWNKWIRYDGKKWVIDDGNQIYQLAIATARHMVTKAQDMDDDERRKFIQHALKSESGQRLNEMVRKAATFPYLQILPHVLDDKPILLNCDNGTLDLEALKLRPHRKEDFLTQISPVVYDPKAECPNWIEHLKTILKGKESLISFLQIACGYSLSGKTDERCFFILWGSGKNGKSTTVKLISLVLGDYGRRTPVETLMVKHGNVIPSDLASLKGRRFVYTSETEEGKRLAESLIKDITGQEKIAARFLYGEWFEFQPQFKLWLSTNHKPVIRGTDRAIWDRVRLIPFTYQIPEAERQEMDELIEKKFKPEFPGILAWMVEGYREWRKYRLFIPDEIKEATESYREEMDILGNFITQCCTIDKRAECTAKNLYESYCVWCRDNGEREISQKMFSLRLQEKGFGKINTRTGIKWIGLTIREGC